MRVLALILLLLALPPVPAGAQEVTQPSGAISTEQTASGDAAIERRIEGILAELEGFDGVTVTVREGIVTLRGEVLNGTDIARLGELAARVDGVVAIENEVTESTDVSQRLDPVIARAQDRLAQAVAYLPLLAVALGAGVLVAATGLLLARWQAPWRRLAPNGFIADIYRTILRLVFVLLGVVVALDILGATAVLTGLLGAAGIVGLAVGFAVKDTVENFIASVMLSLRQPFRPNDFVDIEGSSGTVIRLTSRATVLLDADGNHLRLPNAVVFKSKIINYTRNAERRFGFTLGVDPSADLGRAREVGIAALEGLDFVLADPAPQAWIEAAGDSTVVLAFYGWVNQHEVSFSVARGAALRRVMEALTSAGIALPEPGFRLTVAGGAPVAATPDTPPVRPAPPPPVASMPEDVRPDDAIEQLIAEERRESGAENLLSESAPEE